VVSQIEQRTGFRVTGLRVELLGRQTRVGHTK